MASTLQAIGKALEWNSLKVDIQEAFKAIRENLLRTILTVAIVALGMFALIGVVTTIDALKSWLVGELEGTGARSFEIRDLTRQRRGRAEVSTSKPIDYRELARFAERFPFGESYSPISKVQASVEVKYLSEKTNPNFSVSGVGRNHLDIKSLELDKGRNFSSVEVLKGRPVAIVGKEVVSQLFDKTDDPIDKQISFLGKKFKIVGVLKSEGLSAVETDRSILVPFEAAETLSTRFALTYSVNVTVLGEGDLDYYAGEARGLMRRIRRDVKNDPDSFEVVKGDQAIESINETTSYVSTGGFVIGMVIMLGASIGLMNIMTVSVTERTREIGVRKALGATPSKIAAQFLVEAIVICLMGAAIGIALGVAVANFAAYSLTEEKSFYIPFLWILAGFGISFAVGVLSGFYPAYKASQLDPIDSLRYE